ncbi:hypothetical protein [Methanococcus maripaludis]|uniref:Uncharacterized protein n=1 Tax=Methanococcus maripaludis TaxID=39152 RepID=A0A7J9S1R0_METMI|nr:hypothetical protein [Methanococcus maripaludis]MBB6067874.1 hypothetical protein [Methanococcus maripaludis]
MRQIFLRVLDQTTIDGQVIDDEWLKKYGPTAVGSPANLDHNYYNTTNRAVGKIENIMFDYLGRLHAVVSIFDEVYWEIEEHIKGCSIEWNTDPSGNEGLIRAIAICVNSVPKVEFARGSAITDILASVKKKLEQGDNMGNEGKPEKISDMTLDQFDEHLTSKIGEIMASFKPQDGTPGATPKEGGEGGEPTEITASDINGLTAVLKTALKEIGAVRKENGEIMASIKAGNGPGGNNPPGGDEGDEIVASIEI